jgi:hypothetical protein
MHVLKGIRPLDIVLTVLLAALAAFLGWENVSAPADAELAHPLDSHSVLMIPVFVLAALPVLVRRRAVLPAVAVSTAIVLASLPAFGWVTRCGWALPLSLAYAYAVARFAGSVPRQLVGLVGVLALQVLSLMIDASTGGLWEALPFSVPAAAVCYGVGRLVETLVRRRVAAPTLTPEHSNA